MEKYEDNMPKITIPLELTSNDIRSLYDEIESCDNSFLVEFITHLLQQVDLYAAKQLENAEQILKVNPYSLQRGIKK